MQEKKKVNVILGVLDIFDTYIVFLPSVQYNCWLFSISLIPPLPGHLQPAANHSFADAKPVYRPADRVGAV